MNFTKTTASIILALMIAVGTAVIPCSAKTVKTTKTTLTQYTQKSFSFTKPSSREYKYSVTNNGKKYIGVSFTDNKSVYNFTVTAKSKTSEKKPALTIYYESKGKKVNVKKYSFTVKAPEKIKFSKVKINEKMTKSVTLKNSFTKEYTFKYSKKIAKIDTKNYTRAKTKRTYEIKGVKKGNTTVKVYLKGTKKRIGTFRISVGDYATKVKKSYSPLKLKYSGHGSSNYMKDCNISLDKILRNKKYNASYSVVVNNEKIASTIQSDDDYTIYSVGKGSTSADIYQKIGKKEAEKIATLKIKVTKAKMSYVAKQNMLWFDNGIFGNGEMVEYLSPNETFNMQNTIVSSLINNTYTGSHFKKTRYKITYKSSDPSVAEVNSGGKVTAKSIGAAVINYTITFSDKSTFKGGCPVEVWLK